MNEKDGESLNRLLVDLLQLCNEERDKGRDYQERGLDDFADMHYAASAAYSDAARRVRHAFEDQAKGD